MKKSPKKYFGFTLVELIIVITILAILSTIAFVSFQGYTKSSRDSVRLSSLGNINKSIEIKKIQNISLPDPDNFITISLSGVLLQKYGYIQDRLSNYFGLGKAPLDPEGGSYIYVVNEDNKSFTIGGFLEQNQSYKNNLVYADNSNKTVKILGNNIGILTDINNNLLTQNTDLFLNGSGGSYKLQINDSTNLIGSGLEIGGGLQFLEKSNGDFSSPSSCPDGFISVPGNPDYSQPGFCVAKYEMSHNINPTSINFLDLSSTAVGSCDTLYGSSCTTLATRNSVRYNSGLQIQSKSGFFPIGDILHQDAIKACQKMGNGYHLITNNEWMTIAKSIEINNNNWYTSGTLNTKSGLVGSGYVSIGLNISNLGCKGWSKGLGYYSPRDGSALTGPGGGGTSSGSICDEKRQLELSNGEKIWDLAGNMSEEVNKANTLNGDKYDYGFFSLTGYAQKDCPRNPTVRKNCFELKTGTDYLNTKLKNVIGNTIYDSSNGMGMGVYNGTYINNVLSRGMDSGNNITSGIYSLNSNLPNDGTAFYPAMGFRCAYIKQ